NIRADTPTPPPGSAPTQRGQTSRRFRPAPGPDQVTTLNRISVPQVYRRYRAVLATEHGPRRGLQVTVARDGRRAPLVAPWGGIFLARDTTPTVLNDNPPRIWSNRRSELVQRLLVDTCELCNSGNQVEVHHIRALKDLNPTGRKQQPEWATRMATRHRKTLIVCCACHENIRYSGCSTRQSR
ncbi:MAG: hypothetical protein ACRDS0_29545, partial [Pseudonocardiaceae bacterium]